ncbi:hypothetical protein HMPREF2955_14265 [Prevotella sp. HMSC073D09]|nr:hypothetical protein HMPREF2955_14265 [Prevotella sp. HMSC073D09]
MSSLLEHCHGEKTHFSRNEKRTFSLSQMNNVELARTYCHGEKTYFSRNEKEQILSPYRSFCVNFARHPHPSAWGTPIYI